jgi:hypothetical protein
MTRGHHSLLKLLLAASTMTAVCPVLAADVTPDRLINADREPHNWLMNHRTYDGQRFSPLARIDKGNVKNLKLAYAVPLGGGGAISRRANVIRHIAILNPFPNIAMHVVETEPVRGHLADRVCLLPRVVAEPRITTQLGRVVAK